MTVWVVPLTLTTSVDVSRNFRTVVNVSPPPPDAVPPASASILKNAGVCDLNRNESVPSASVVRQTGLYGPGRQGLLNQVRQGYRVASEPPLYGNRIHVDDAAGLLAFLLQADASGVALEDCYIGVDDEPAPLHEVVAWLREQLHVSHWSEGSTVRRAGSKRCSNARARALGWTPQYPTFREGYRAILQQL